MSEYKSIHMYHEISTIKTYHRKKNDDVKSFNQINLGYFSKFEKDVKVAIINAAEFKKLLQEYETNKNDCEILNSKVDDLTKANNIQNNELLKQNKLINDLTDTVEKLTQDNDKYSHELSDKYNEIDNLKSKLDAVNDENEKLRTIIANKKAEISDKDAENKRYYGYTLALTTAIAELNSRSFLDRLRNKKPKTYESIIEKIPQDVLLLDDDSGIEIPKVNVNDE